MKPVTEIPSGLFDNKSQFSDPFFKRFQLRHAPQPLQLNDQISKNYLFPTFYGDVTCAIGIFMCSYDRAQALMPHPKIKPIRMTKGRSLVAFSCYEYKNVLNVAPYNEIAMTIPVMVDPAINVPILPMILNVFSNFGYYVFSMPVTSLENKIRGRKIWGLPKEVQEIDLFEEGNDCVTVAKEESGEAYFKLRVPMQGKPTPFDVKTYLYSRLGNQFLKSETNFKATFQVKKYMQLLFQKDVKPDRSYLEIGNSPSAQMLNDLQIEEHPFQFRFAKQMTSCFDLADPNYQSPIKWK